MCYMKFMVLASFVVLCQNTLAEEPSPNFSKTLVQPMFSLPDASIAYTVFIRKSIQLDYAEYEVHLTSHGYDGVPNTLGLPDLYSALPDVLPTNLCYGDGDGTQWHTYRQLFVWEEGRLVPREHIEWGQPSIAVILNFSPLARIFTESACDQDPTENFCSLNRVFTENACDPDPTDPGAVA